MKLFYYPSPLLAPLAWVATIPPGASVAAIVHGHFLETQPGFFIEGAWAGEFAGGDMQESDAVFGSGGTLADGGLTFVSSIATTDSIYYSARAHATAVSNSLPLLLAVLEDELAPECTEYSPINMSILQGIRSYRAAIPTRKGQVHRLMHHNLRVGPNGIELVDKPLPPHFHDFTSYRDHLLDRVGKLFANARHPARNMPLQVCSTQSKGYDSTAVNALARPFGIDMVYTSTRSKERGGFYQGQRAELPSDDGTPICATLGLPCTPIDRLGFRDTLTNEHFYWAGLDNNQDLNLHQIQSFVDRPTLLLTGNLGEIWYTREAIGKARLPTVNEELIRWDQAGHGLGEVRLKAGMVQAAVPFIGARRRAEILQITESVEMDAYRLGGAYDRPIPRRIAEEAGVPREMFGQVKLASIVHLPTPNVPVTPELRAEFFRHLVDNKLLGPVGIRLLPVVQRLNNWIYWRNPNRHFDNRRKHPLLWFLGYGYAKMLGTPLRFRMIWPHVDSHLYAFCVNKVRGEYARQLGDPHRVPDHAMDVRRVCGSQE